MGFIQCYFSWNIHSGGTILFRIAVFLCTAALLFSCGPGVDPYENISKLPDPFLLNDGSYVSSVEEWETRRAELAIIAQNVEFGIKPDIPSAISSVWSEMKGSGMKKITVSCSENGENVSFKCTIEYPETGSGPFPAVIGIGYSFLNNSDFLEQGVAVISFPNDSIAAQGRNSDRGKGIFYEIYGSDHSAGAMIAWAWGVSCLIDALEDSAEANINASRLAVTGCSRNGKGALVAGAFDERIVLTIPQESGAGGSASWRVSELQKSMGNNVQTLSQIVTENCWFSSNFANYSNRVDDLPIDQHSIMALCAPRGLLVIENTSMEWLGNFSTWVSSNVAHKVWVALDVPGNMAFSQVGHGDHCGLPVSQFPIVNAYVKKFLLDDDTANTEMLYSDGNFSFSEETWIDWTVPEFL